MIKTSFDRQVTKAKMEIVWQEVPLREILNYYVKRFKLPNGEDIYSWEAFVDTAKERVIYKLVLKAEILASEPKSRRQED